MTQYTDGWPVPPSEPTHVWEYDNHAPGIDLLDNYVGYCMIHLAHWWNERIQPLKDHQTFGGINFVRPPRGQSSGISRHCAYIAEDFDSLENRQGAHHPSLSNEQVRLIHNRLYWYDCIAHGVKPMPTAPRGWDSNAANAVIRWGGDYKRAPEDDMHNEWNRTPQGAVLGKRLANHLLGTPRGMDISRRNPGSEFVRSHHGR